MQSFLLQKSAVFVFIFLLAAAGFLFLGKTGFLTERAAEIVFNEAKFIFSNLNFFQAGIAPNIEQTFQSEEIAEETEEENISDSYEDENLLVLQEQLDDAAEVIDVLNQKTAEFIARNNSEKDFTENNKEESEEIFEEQAQDEEEIQDEETQSEEEEIPDNENEKAIVNTEQKFCEKGVDNLPRKDKIIINEFAWMGTENSANNEWIELKNVSSEPVSLAGWQLMDKDKQIKVIFNPQAIVPAHGFFLLERTDDTTLPNIKADLIYQGGLNNVEEALFIFYNNCQLADEALAMPDWLAGDNASKQTMERKSDFSWQTSVNPGGTPQYENSAGYLELNTVSVAGIGGGGAAPAAEPPIQEPSPKILITEIQTSDASSSDNDFIELYNPNATSADVSDWQLKKKNSSGNESSIRVFPENSIIGPENYFIWMNSDYASQSIILADATSSQTLANNNSAVLLDKNKNIIDAVAWGTSTDPFMENSAFSENPTDNQTLGRKWSTTTQSYSETDNNQDDFEIQIPTPGAQNQNQAFQFPLNQPPVALFVFAPENPIINQEIIFNAASSTDADGAIALYVWDFGDNISSTTTEATTTHSYSVSGDFIINLQVIDDQSATSSFATNTINVVQEEIPTLAVVINEVAWMGTNSQNSSDEWIELYNNTLDDIDLNDWTFTWSHGTTTRSLIFSTSTGATTTGAATTILAQKFFLLERSDDDQTISDIPYDQFFTGALDNNGERLELRNASGTLIDAVDASVGWFAGTTSPAYISMERINSNATGSDFANWANNNLIVRNGKSAKGTNINGTPASQNSVSKPETEIDGLYFDAFYEFDEITFTYLGNPYIIKNTLYVPQNKKLIIEPAVTLKFYIPDIYGPDEGAYLKMDGVLEAIGEQGKEILFTSTGNLWPGIIFESETPETEISSRMEYVKIEKARTWELDASAAVKIIKKAVSIKNSTFENYYDLRGLYLLNSSSSIENVIFNNFNASSSEPETEEYPSGIFIDRGNPTIKNNTFNNNYQGIVVGTTETCLQNSDFKISGNTFNGVVIPIFITNTGFPCFEQNQIADLQRDGFGNIFNGVVYQGANMEQDNLWQSDSPIILEKGFSVQNATLTVAAGVTVRFKHSNDISPNTFLKIDSAGRLITQGVEGNLVIFTSNEETPAAGDWQAVWFADGSSGEMNFTKISYGGFGADVFRNECLVVESPDVVLNSVEKEFCDPYQ